MSAFQLKKISTQDLMADYGVMGPFSHVLLGLEKDSNGSMGWGLAAAIHGDDVADEIERAFVHHKKDSSTSVPEVTRRNFDAVFDAMKEYLQTAEARVDRLRLIQYAQSLTSD